MLRAGRSNGMRSVSSTEDLWARPMPRMRRPPLISWVVRAWAASMSGWRGQVEITAVPNSMVDVARPTTASTVRASGAPSWATQ